MGKRNDWLSLRFWSVGSAVSSDLWCRVQERSVLLLPVSIVLKQTLSFHSKDENPPHEFTSLPSQWEGTHYLSRVLCLSAQLEFHWLALGHMVTLCPVVVDRDLVCTDWQPSFLC